MEAASQRQRKRFADLENGVMTNADMRVAEVRQFCELDELKNSGVAKLMGICEIISL